MSGSRRVTRSVVGLNGRRSALKRSPAKHSRTGPPIWGGERGGQNTVASNSAKVKGGEERTSGEEAGEYVLLKKRKCGGGETGRQKESEG